MLCLHDTGLKDALSLWHRLPLLLEGDLASECILWLQRLLELEAVAHDYNPSSLELGGGRVRVQGQPGLDSKFLASIATRGSQKWGQKTNKNSFQACNTRRKRCRDSELVSRRPLCT